MRAGGMTESSKWKKQKRSPRPSRHMIRSTSGQMDQAQLSALSNNLSGKPLPQTLSVLLCTSVQVRYTYVLWEFKIHL